MSSIDPIIPGGVGSFGSTPISVVGPPLEEDVAATTKHSAYSLDGTTWIDFPVGPRFDLIQGNEESNIVIDTDSGFRRIYRQYRRYVWRLTFKIQKADIQSFVDLHQAVRGATIPFYVTLDKSTDPIVAIYGKKTAGALNRGTGEKVLPPVFTYEMTVQSEPY